MCGGGLWSHREIIGDVVRPGELGAYARGCGYRCYFFLLYYLGTILRFPQSPHTEPSVPGVRRAEQRQGVSGETI